MLRHTVAGAFAYQPVGFFIYFELAGPVAARGNPISIRLATEGGQPVLASALATALAGLQDLVFQLGDERLGHEPRASGRHRKDVQNNFALRITSLKTGSALVTLAIPSAQAGLDHRLPESARVEQDLQDLLRLIKSPEATPKEMGTLLPDVRRRRVVHRSIKKFIPGAPGHYLDFGLGQTQVQLRSLDVQNATRLLIAATPEGQTTYLGRVTGLRVDKARSFIVDTAEGEKTVHYPQELEDVVRDALGNIALVPVFDDGKEARLGGGDGIDILDALPLDSFAHGGKDAMGTIDPAAQLEIEVDSSGAKECYIGRVEEFDIVVRDLKVSGLVRAAKEAIGELWEIYVGTEESRLTDGARRLRHRLMERLGP